MRRGHGLRGARLSGYNSVTARSEFHQGTRSKRLTTRISLFAEVSCQRRRMTVWLLLIWAQFALCSLPANLDTLQFIPGDPAPSFTAYLQQEPPLSFNAWATQPSADLPLLLFAADPSDPFGHYMSLNNQSIDSFLQSGPSGVQTILSSWTKPTSRRCVLPSLAA